MLRSDIPWDLLRFSDGEAKGGDLEGDWGLGVVCRSGEKCCAGRGSEERGIVEGECGGREREREESWGVGVAESGEWVQWRARWGVSECTDGDGCCE